MKRILKSKPKKASEKIKPISKTLPENLKK